MWYPAGHKVSTNSASILPCLLITKFSNPLKELSLVQIYGPCFFRRLGNEYLYACVRGRGLLHGIENPNLDLDVSVKRNRPKHRNNACMRNHCGSECMCLPKELCSRASCKLEFRDKDLGQNRMFWNWSRRLFVSVVAEDGRIILYPLDLPNSPKKSICGRDIFFSAAPGKPRWCFHDVCLSVFSKLKKAFSCVGICPWT